MKKRAINIVKSTQAKRQANANSNRKVKDGAAIRLTKDEVSLSATGPHAERKNLLDLLSGMAEASTSEIAELSVREWDVLYLGALGKTKAQTARLLGLSTHTVNQYMRQVLKKLDAPNVANGVYIAMKRNLIE